jgi:short-subunit dehydrogenase
VAEPDFTEKYGPYALVTGASSGIGESFAENLAAKGMNLVLVARRLDRLDALAAKLHADHGVNVKTYKTDLGDIRAATEMLDITSSLDIGLVVSNAGFSLKGDHANHDMAALTEMLMVNCHTPTQLAHGFIPRLRARGKGGLIFTSSIEALIGVPFSAAYSATKGFVNRLAEGLWGELTPDNIDVLALCPGATDTEALQRMKIDRASLPHLMSSTEVVRLAFENIANGPVFIASAHYKAMFDQLLAMPQRDALRAMAGSLRK